MDKITLIDKGVEFMTIYAAPSVLTGNFVARVVDSDVETIQTAFTNPGPIFVHNMQSLFADKTYTGYTGIDEIRQGADDIIVILHKEAEHDTEGD